MGAEDGGIVTSPRPAAKTPMASRLQSPPPFPLGSNDDQLERARARAAARAASIRRKSLAASIAPNPNPNADDLLNRDQIMELFHNCIKLASENKINQKNTWELGLIDHLSEIIQAGADEDDETNFQKASCTLEAGVKIYSLRVDSAHSEAYKVLGGINRAGREEEKESSEGDNADIAQTEDINKKDLDRKISPVSTLESSFEALNVKKYDVAFSVDPLYHQTTAQFDEGGAKGLLLYNLGVYGGCRVLFDSFEVPEKCILTDVQSEETELVDLSFVKEQVEKMIVRMPLCKDISPTLRHIVAQFDEENHRPSYEASSGQVPVMENDMVDNNDLEHDDTTLPDCGTWNFNDCDDHESVADDGCNIANFNSTSYQEASDEYIFEDPQGPGVDEKFDKIADFLTLGLGLHSRTNAWAGPEHWKYRKSKDLEPIPTSSVDSEVVSKTTSKKRGKEQSDIDFTKALEHQIPNIFAQPKNPKSLLQPANKGPCNVKLPEDCHYRPESLVKLFVLPDVLCLARKGREPLDESREDYNNFIPTTPCDDDSTCSDHVDNGNVCSDAEDPGSLISKPRQVNKIDIQYDKVSKQVDVHALKEVLWNHIHKSADSADVVAGETSVCLSQILRQFPKDTPEASAKEISPHLYFICLLHLANEHCLKLGDRSTLDDVDIYVPSSLVK